MKIALLGDLALFGKYSSLRMSFAPTRFKKMADFLSNYDLVVGNLETPLTKASTTCSGKSAYIKGDPQDASLLKYLNISAVCLANNHIFDYGYCGLKETQETLNYSGIEYFGVNGKEFLFSREGINLVFVGYCCYSTNPVGVWPQRMKGNYISQFQPLLLGRKITECSDANSIVIASIHAGEEHVNYPSNDHIQIARRLSKKGKYVYYGHHPHVVQGIESVNDSVLAYSLGNFCFDDVYSNKSKLPLVKQSENNRSGLILELEIQSDLKLNYKAIPIFDDGDEIILLNGQFDSKLKKYSDELSRNPDEYKAMRQSLIDEYKNSRKHNRSMSWYLKRFSPNTIIIIAKAIMNRILYKFTIKRYLRNE